MPRVSKVFFPFSFPTLPPSLSLFLSLSLSPSSFSFLLGSAHPGRRREPGGSCCHGCCLSPSYWDWVNGADGWRRAVKMEAFVPPPPPLPRARWQRQPSLLTLMQAPTLPSRLQPPPLHPSGSALPTPWLHGSRPSQPLRHGVLSQQATLFLGELPFPHRSGTRAPAHTCTHKHTHAQMQLLAWKATATQAGTPSPPRYSSSSLSLLCKEWESKKLTAAWEINHVSIWFGREGMYEWMKEVGKQKGKNNLQTSLSIFWVNYFHSGLHFHDIKDFNLYIVI